MPKRNTVLATNEIYHIYNRAIAREHIFSSQAYLKKTLEIANYYRFPQDIRLSVFNNLPKELKENYFLAMKNKIPLVEIYSFALMPNHYHFLLKQTQEKGIIKFISNFQNSFAKHFNTKNKRDGGLFQSPFKGKWVETDDQFIHISRYIHLNPVTSYLVKFEELFSYPWTSFPAYANGVQNLFVNCNLLLGMFPSREKYVSFVSDQVDYQRNLAIIKDLIVD